MFGGFGRLSARHVAHTAIVVILLHIEKQVATAVASVPEMLTNILSTAVMKSAKGFPWRGDTVISGVTEATVVTVVTVVGELVLPVPVLPVPALPVLFVPVLPGPPVPRDLPLPLCLLSVKVVNWIRMSARRQMPSR